MVRRSPRHLAPVAVLLLIGLAYLLLQLRTTGPADSSLESPARPGDYLLCSWNVENLFDDRDDSRNRDDEEFDSWFATHARDRELKLQRLVQVLGRMNAGCGPDILGVCEVESKRAAQLLATALNDAIPAHAAPYRTVIMEEINAGRHIGPAIISRLPVSIKYRPRVLQPQRILIANLVASGHELVVMASHWTSRKSDSAGTQRRKYADLIYGRANEIYHRDPGVDLIVCGDFNDTPEDITVRDHLHASGDVTAVRTARELRFLDLLAGKDPRKLGTYYYGKPMIYDHICISPGMLNGQGWSCDIDSLQVPTSGLIAPGVTQRRPWRFGGRNDTFTRGFSDHFPVIVNLHVQDGEVLQ